MPFVDVANDLLRDPDFAQTLQVVRQVQTVDGNGMTQITPTPVSPAPIGVVVPGVPSDVVLDADYEHNLSDISVYAADFRFLGPTASTQPDQVIWQGVTYLVKAVVDFTQFGAGYSLAICRAESLLGSTSP